MNSQSRSGSEPSESDGDEQLLNQFRDWLTEARDEAATLAGPRHPSTGLFDLVESFTALRQELKLQTKSTRALHDSTESALVGLNAAIDEFHAIPSHEAEAAKAAERPLVESLADVCESLDRGRRGIEGARQLMQSAAPQVSEIIDAEVARRSFWARQACRLFAGTLKTRLEEHITASQEPALNSLLEGYSLIQQRLRRAMMSHGVERIECVGRAVDVHCMTVVEVVDDPEQAAGTVTEEIRPGFLWRGEVLRFAEVKAVRKQPNSNAEQLSID